MSALMSPRLVPLTVTDKDTEENGAFLVEPILCLKFGPFALRYLT